MVTALSVLSVLGTILLVLALALMLGWAYSQTRLPSILAFLIYSILVPIFALVTNTFIIQAVASESNQWLGETVGERVAAFNVVSGLLARALFTALLAWMVLELVRWAQRQRTASFLNTETKETPIR